MTYSLAITDQYGTVIYEAVVSAHPTKFPDVYLVSSDIARRGLGLAVLDAIDDYEAKVGNA